MDIHGYFYFSIGVYCHAKKKIANACSDGLSQDTVFCPGDKMPGKTRQHMTVEGTVI